MNPGQNFKATLGWQAQNVNINTQPEISQFGVHNPTGELRSGKFADVGKGIENKADISCPLNQGDTLVQQGSEELKPEKKVAVKFVSKEKQQALSAIK